MIKMNDITATVFISYLFKFISDIKVLLTTAVFYRVKTGYFNLLEII